MDSTFYLLHTPDGLKLDPKHKYYYQVQLQLSICEVNYCDFIVWTVAGMVTIRVYRNENFFNQIQPKLHSFFVKHILSELLTKNLQNSLMTVTTAASGSGTAAATSSDVLNDLYCYCQQPEKVGRRMIGCDNENCSNYKWFHFECLGLKRKPRGHYWYCPECKE